MPAVVTIDQRASRMAPSQVEEWTEWLNEAFGAELTLPFAVTVGDEIQALVSDATAIVDIVLTGVRNDGWWLGLGLGAVDTPLPSLAPRGRGAAFYAAREAVELAKRSPYGFAVRSPDEGRAKDAQTILELLGFVIHRRGRTAKRWQAIELAREGANTVQIGERLGISQQAASKRLRNAGFEEEVAGRRLAARLIADAMEAGATDG